MRNITFHLNGPSLTMKWFSQTRDFSGAKHNTKMHMALKPSGSKPSYDIELLGNVNLLLF